MQDFFKTYLGNLSELQLRLLTGFSGFGLFIVALVYSEWAYFILFFLICMMTLREFYKLLGLDGNLPLTSFGLFNGLFLYTLTFVIKKFHLDTNLYILVLIGLSGAYFIKLYDSRENLKPFADIAFTFLGVLYVALPFSLLHLAVFFNGKYTFQVILGALMILWASDTGAYFAGKKFGRRKLFQRISPKKTWEGSIGGALLATATGITLSFFFNELILIQWVGFILIIVVVGNYGDLVESLFKRSIKIKDSGNTLPGHGGFLDRFDGLLLAAPFITAFLYLYKP